MQIYVIMWLNRQIDIFTLRKVKAMYKERFASALEGYEKFWNRENSDRCILNISGSLTKIPFRNYTSIQEKWLDENFIYD